MTIEGVKFVRPDRASRSRITLGAVQIRSQPGAVEANCAHATPLIEKAAAHGAEVVVLPELFSSGYIPNPAIWDMAEEREQGPMRQWLAATARRLGIYLGAGSVERDGSDFFNVFVLADPNGGIAGRAYKSDAEANVFRRGRDEHVIDTALGRIGIGICADNQLVAQLQLMHERDVDVVLMPHAWPTPARASGHVSEADVATLQRRMIELPVLYARSLGVPVVFVNQVGPLVAMGGIIGRLMKPKIWRLRGQSRIVDSDGSVLAQLDEDEDALVATAKTTAANEPFQEPNSYGRYLQPGSALVRNIILPIDIAHGRLSYRLSQNQRRTARTRTT
ncbi:MAG TPA: carbon-nitrogen hydrolase family protein [Solirubrobacteraceae bacterium]|nr:carbon-nitrogen hydrolase family protein [Solirubrobacteraceae bacterium]